MSDDNGGQAGLISLSEVSIIDTTGTKKIMLNLLFAEIDLFEDIFSNFMSGTITMVEGFNLVADLPIIGEELVYISYNTPEIPEEITKLFYVYKVSDKIVADKKIVYVLHIISQEFLTDINSKESRSWAGNPTDIVKKIFKENFEVDPLTITATNVPVAGVVLDASPASNHIKFVSNYWTPAKCINYAASHAQSNTTFGAPTYLFFETNKKYKFTSLEELYAQSPRCTYRYDRNPRRGDISEPGDTVRDINREYETAESMTIDTAVDFIDRMMNGAYGHRNYAFNLLQKNYNIHAYDYYYDFTKSSHLESKTISGGSGAPMTSKFVWFDSWAKIDNSVIVPYMHNSITKDKSAEIAMKRVSLLSQTEFFQIDLVVPGRSDLQAGDVVTFEMQKFETTDSESTQDTPSAGEDAKDPYLSGKYLVSAIQHRITATRHKMIIQLIKDSFVSDKLMFKNGVPTKEDI